MRTFSHRRARPGAFTLLEMLVTLVVVSLIGVLVSQALFQLSRIERLLDSSQVQSLAPALRTEWLRGALLALAPVSVLSPQRFTGTPTELSGLSTQVPAWPPMGVAVLRLRLSYDANSDRSTLLLLAPAGEGQAPGERADALLSWPGKAGRFRYRTPAGTWLDRWPEEPVKPDAASLPALIAIETGSEQMPLLLASPLGKIAPATTRAQLEML